MDEAGRKSCFEFMGTETTSPSTSTVIPPPTPTSTGDSSGGSPDASQETPSSAAGRLMSLDSVGATSSIAIASAVVWSILN